jgi:hypothetical protein
VSLLRGGGKGLKDRYVERAGENSPFWGNELEIEITSFVAEGGGQEYKIFSQGGQLPS